MVSRYGVVWDMCMKGVMLDLSLWAPFFASFFVSWDTCVCWDFVYGNFVWGPIYVNYDYGYEKFDWVMMLWGWVTNVVVEYEYTIDVVHEDVGVWLSRFYGLYNN